MVVVVSGGCVVIGIHGFIGMRAKFIGGRVIGERGMKQFVPAPAGKQRQWKGFSNVSICSHVSFHLGEVAKELLIRDDAVLIQIHLHWFRRTGKGGTNKCMRTDKRITR